jgi:HEXXH motif-containing protein
LQGAYAHIAVVDFWRGKAKEQFARWHAHTSEAVEQLLKSGSLTSRGRDFAEAMGQSLEA